MPSTVEFKGMGLTHRSFPRPHPDGMGEVIVTEFLVPSGFISKNGVVYRPVGYVISHGQQDIFGSKNDLKSWQEIESFLSGSPIPGQVLPGSNSERL